MNDIILETSFKTQGMDKYGAYQYLEAEPDADNPDSVNVGDTAVWSGGRGSYIY